MSIGQRLKQLREQKGMTLEAVAKHLGVATQTIYKYEKEIVTNIPAANVEKLAELFGVSPSSLLGWDCIPNIIPVSMRSFPLLGDIACGKPIIADQRYDAFAAAGFDEQVSFALRCKGDSMINARIFDGDIVFIREQDMVRNGEIAAVVIGDEATLKRVYFYPNEQKMILVSENPAYPPLSYQGAALDEIRILGKAVAFQSEVR
jgi:repressor LexA